MRISIVSTLLLPALALALPADPTPAALTPSSSVFSSAGQTISPTLAQPTPETPSQILELRQADVTLGATLNEATQVPAVTTNWQETTIGGLTTYVPVVYSQSFANVPDQLSSASPGTIGLGTLTGDVGTVKTSEAEKGDAAAGVSVTRNQMLGIMGAVVGGLVAGAGLL